MESWINNGEHEVVPSFEYVVENEPEHPNPKYKNISRDYISMPVILMSKDEFEAKMNDSTKIEEATDIDSNG